MKNEKPTPQRSCSYHEPSQAEMEEHREWLLGRPEDALELKKDPIHDWFGLSDASYKAHSPLKQ